MTNKYKSGFTLIELLVVVLIVGILAAVALPQYEVAVAKARYSTVMPLLTHYKQEQELFYLNNSRYAESWQELAVPLPDGADLRNDTSFYWQKIYWNISSTRVMASLYSVVRGLEYAVEFANTPHPDRRSCVAYDNYSVSVKVCKNLGGVKYGGGTAADGPFSAYELP